MAQKSKITLFLLGGTIAMSPSEFSSGGVVPKMSAEDLCKVIPDIESYADITARTLKKVASANLSILDAIRLKAEIEQHVKKEECDGVIVVQGTDTLEEMAFFLDLILDVPVPVIVTGAMRSANMVSADGSANILSSVIAATHKPLAKSGVVVLMNDDIHAARYVQKCHTRNVAAFKSVNGGVLGEVCEGKVSLNYYPERMNKITIKDNVPVPKVGLLKATFGDQGEILKLISDADFDGLVVEAFGAGHLPESWLDIIDVLVKEMPVILCSRTLEGRVFENTYGYKGAEIDLIARGLIPAGILDGLKARLYMQAVIMSGRPVTKPGY